MTFFFSSRKTKLSSTNPEVEPLTGTNEDAILRANLQENDTDDNKL